MTILLLGADGQVGWELRRSLAVLGNVVALTRNSATNLDNLCGDLGDASGLATTVDRLAPRWIVNAGAYTAVDRAEAERDKAHALNAVAPGLLAAYAARHGGWLIHYSTDYVFDGSGTAPWTEADATGPLNVYGQTKLDGEEAIRATAARHLILRTSWVYGARGGNFAKTMLRLAGERDTLNVVADQVGAPTGAELIADATAHAMRLAANDPDASGTYHLAASGETSWHGYARFAIGVAVDSGAPLRAGPDAVLPIASSGYPVPALRPLNSRLDTTRFTERFGLTLPDWRLGVRRMLSEHLAHGRI